MDEVHNTLDLESQEQEKEPEGAIEEQTMAAEERSVQGSVHIAEDVITELARKTLSLVPGVQPANPGLASKLGLVGRKAIDGIKVSVEENVTQPLITVDVFVLVKYGLRIPDVAWDLQEAVKNNLEQYTGYAVKAVNVNVQGIFINDRPAENVVADTEKLASDKIPTKEDFTSGIDVDAEPK